jgi:hypothetical protein
MNSNGRRRHKENRMDYETKLGGNRTGVQTSPLATAAMERGMESFLPPASDAREDMRVRREYADATDGLGSVPPPGTIKGMAKSGIDMLSGSRPQVLIDKLGQRLAFERGGTRLYDTLLVKCDAADSTLPPEDVAMLRRFRDEEAEHFMLVVQALEGLGADPTAQTPSADLVGVEAAGLVQAMNDPRTSLVQSLNVMLDAELIDNAAWEMLIELARDLGHDRIADSFALAATQEAEHLTQVRALVARLSKEDASMTSFEPATSRATQRPGAI